MSDRAATNPERGVVLTQKMINAGVAALENGLELVCHETIVVEVYTAMQLAKRGDKSRVSHVSKS